MIELLIAAAMTTSAAPAARPAFEATVVQLHNQERASVGSPPLEWDDRLARDAAVWADHLADIDDLVHWGEENSGDNGQGENLWLGTRGGFDLAQMVGGWSEEKKPLARLASWEDDFETVGHYTQMVWAGTRKVGCAVRSNRTNDVLVCRYFPAGNVTGEQPYPRPPRTVFAAR